jgi:hypothetical protein
MKSGWVTAECIRHDVSIFPGMFGSGIASHSCDSWAGNLVVAKLQCLHPAVNEKKRFRISRCT